MDKKRLRVFLGGTCANSTWRETLIPLLKGVDYFNPVVKDWTSADQKNELIERNTCDFLLYVISPEMEGVYSIAEVVDDSNKRPEKTIFCVIPYTKEAKFSKAQLKSLEAVKSLVRSNGGEVCNSLVSISSYLETKGITEFYRKKWNRS